MCLLVNIVVPVDAFQNRSCGSMSEDRRLLRQGRWEMLLCREVDLSQLHTVMFYYEHPNQPICRSFNIEQARDC
jgi:hypothetical protein